MLAENIRHASGHLWQTIPTRRTPYSKIVNIRLLGPSNLTGALAACSLACALAGLRLPAQSLPPYAVGGRTLNSRIWQSTSLSTNPITSRVHVRTNQIVELGTGLHFIDSDGNLAETREEIILYPDASGASATNGPCKLFLPADLAQGVIELVAPDGVVQRSRPLGIVLSQGSNRLFVAGITNAIGKLLPAGNQVLYENLINEAGFRCDLLLTYRARGVECDLVIRAAASPAQWNFDPELCSLQLLTEFFATDPPLQTNQKIDPGTGSQTADISFGALSMRPGKAFTVGTQATSSPLGQQSVGRKTPQDLAVDRQPIPISRTWQVLDKRSFIVESTPWKLLATQIARLTAALVPGHSPAARTASAAPARTPRAASPLQISKPPPLQSSTIQKSINPSIHSAALRLPPPVPARPGPAKMQLASFAPTASPGLVWVSCKVNYETKNCLKWLTPFC